MPRLIDSPLLRLVPLLCLIFSVWPCRAATEPARISPAWSGPTAGEETLSLSGPWQFTVDPSVAAGGERAWDTLQVPGNWDTQPAYAKHRGRGWYRREFAVPATWPADARLRLRFEAVYQDAEVTLNGRILGGHVGGYTPFEFDVTDQVRRDTPNVVVVRADNSYHRGAWWPWGGISREVTLRANADLRIVSQQVTAEPASDGGANFRVRVRVANASNREREVTLSPSVRALGIVGATDSAPTEAPLKLAAATLKVPAGGAGEHIFETTLPPRSATPWHFDQPYLHSVETELREDAKLLHARRDRFGIRRAEMRADGFYLNGERIRGGGFNRVSDGPGTGNTEPDWLVRMDVDLMKRAGAVFSRLMHHPQAPNLLDYLDERGLMIVAEIPVWGEGDPHLTADNPEARAWLAEMIERDYNHPAIVGWSVGNEIQRHFDYVRTLAEHARHDLDPGRFVTYVSYTAYRAEFAPQNDPLTFCDAALFTTYTDKPEVYLQRVRKMRSQWPDKPVFAAEFGVKQIGAAPSSVVPNFAALWAGITREPYVIGGALWTLNDYRSDYKGTPASGNREWGVVDLERRPKAAYEEARRVFAPARSLEFDAARIRLTPRGADEAPSYILRGYRLEWTSLAKAGGVQRRGVVALPDLRPGDAAWEGPSPADDLASVRLVTPLGYEVLDGTPGASRDREARPAQPSSE